MARFLLTPSLYQSWLWYSTAEDDGEARRDLITYLKREQITPSPAMLRGRKFEDDVRAAADGAPMLPIDDDPLYENVINDIAEIVKGGLWQERIYHDIRFRDHGDFLLYGKIDVLRGPWVFDIKWSESRYEVGKYFKGIQHIAYPVGSGCPNFAYLISNGRDWYREDYYYSRNHYEEMRSRLAMMLDDIMRDKELVALYRQHWQADRERS